MAIDHIIECLGLKLLRSWMDFDLLISGIFSLGSFTSEPQQKKERVKRPRMKDDRSSDKSTNVKKVRLVQWLSKHDSHQFLATALAFVIVCHSVLSLLSMFCSACKGFFSASNVLLSDHNLTHIYNWDRFCYKRMERKEKLLFLIIHDTFALYIWLPFEGLSVCVADDNKLHWSYFILIKCFFYCLVLFWFWCLVL